MANKIAFARWIAGLEDPEAPPELTEALRSGRALSDLALTIELLSDGVLDASQVATLLSDLRLDGWIAWDWLTWPQDASSEPPTHLSADQLDRIQNIRVTPEGYAALIAQQSVTADSPASRRERVPAHDCFICHASADKDEVARPLAEELRRREYDVWYDEFVLEVGDSLHRSIEDGLASCRAGVVIFSEAFFERDWPQQELNGLVARETSGGERLILPVWHGIDAAFLAHRAPMLADRFALNTADGVEENADRIGRVLNRRRQTAIAIPGDAGGPTAPVGPRIPAPAQGANPLDLIKEGQRVRLGLSVEEHAEYVRAGGHERGPGWMTVMVGPASLQEHLIDPTVVRADRLREIEVPETWDAQRLTLANRLEASLDGFTAQAPEAGPPGYWLRIWHDGLMEFGVDFDRPPMMRTGDPEQDLVIPTTAVAQWAHAYTLFFLAVLDEVGYAGEVVAQIVFNHVEGHTLGVDWRRYFVVKPIDRARIDGYPIQGLSDEIRTEVGRWIKRALDRLFLAAGISTGAHLIDEEGKLVEA